MRSEVHKVALEMKSAEFYDAMTQKIEELKEKDRELNDLKSALAAHNNDVVRDPSPQP